MKECKICGKEIKDLRALSIHLNKHPEVSKEMYYIEFLNDEPKICPVCGEKSTRFLNLIQGYSLYCSRTCASKAGWIDNDKRKKDAAEAAVIKNKNGTFGFGRPKGSKNKNPYPMTESVLKRMTSDKLESWIKAGREFWENASEEDLLAVKHKKMTTSLKNRGFEWWMQDSELLTIARKNFKLKDIETVISFSEEEMEATNREMSKILGI